MPRATLRAQCPTLFSSLDHQVLDYLILARWYDRQAAADGIVITDAAVRRQFQRDKHEAYPNEAAFQTFLKQTGQTVGDVLFRIRANLASVALLHRFHGRLHPLDRSVRIRWRPLTYCRQY